VGSGSFTLYVLPQPVTVTSLTIATVKVGTGKKARKTTGLVLQFSAALNMTQAQSLTAFHLLSGKVKKSRTTYSKPVPLSSAIYNASAHTVTLIPKSKLNLAQPEQLRITASLLTDSLGRPIDGNHDGQPGGDYVVILSKGKVTPLAVPRTTAAAVDIVIQEPGLAASAAIRRRRALG
jgi:hypothetical protein